MSKERSVRKGRLNNRVTSKKGVICKFCGNNKAHTDGNRLWCTKCKRGLN
jgi:hypothetical protein